LSVKRKLPVLERVELTNFTLYQNMRHVDVTVGPGVFCLAGANGMGKSTFLAAVNYGYTGIVPQPDRTFKSVDEYYRFSLPYAADYFDGRVDETDRDSAEVRISFSIDSVHYEVARNFFEPQSLTYLSVKDDQGNPLIDTEGLDGAALHTQYTHRILQDCRLNNFEQFVFLQLFLVTFDERRHLIFWDATVTEPALYLAFGLEAHEASTAGELRRNIERADSLARNAQWQATAARKRLNALGDPADEEQLKDLKRQYDDLCEVSFETSKLFAAARREYDDAELRVAELSAKHAQLRQSYDHAFAHRMQANRTPRLHPVVQSAINSHKCELCGSEGEQVARHVEQILESGHCPLCASKLVVATNPGAMDELEAIDRDLTGLQKDLKDAQARARRLRSEMDERGRNVEVSSDALMKFEAEHTSALALIADPNVSTIAQRAAAKAEFDDAVKRRDDQRAKRDAFRRELKPLQKKLATAYEDAELRFVPLFRHLAHQFIGLDLDIFLGKTKAEGKAESYNLQLEVQGTRRQTTSELSESQRFFLDIALRMALLQHMSGQHGAGMLIDTPEGSLDISYEKRAGSMFAGFINDGYQIVMTANINASQLLVQLASVCGKDRMKLVRMTEWAPLSEVQAESEDLFDKAFQFIEKALVTANPQLTLFTEV
jgi:hypothetical protein